MAHDSEPLPSRVSARDFCEDEPGGSLKRAFIAGFTITCLITAAVKVLMAYGADPLRWSQANAGVASKVFPVDFAGQAFVISGQNVRRIERREDGSVEQIELAVSWPQTGTALLASADAASASIGLSEAIFLTLKRGPTRVAAAARLHGIYPYYFDGGPVEADHGLKKYRFKPGSPYAGQNLYVGVLNDVWTTMRCDVSDSEMMPAMCRREMVMWDDVTVSYRFQRGHLAEWKAMDAAVRAFLAGVRQQH